MDVPSGGIIIWSGFIPAIPDGFVICDGTLATPDLRDRFIVGAGGAHAVNDAFGSDLHQHDFTGDGHFHTHSPGTGIATGANRNVLTTTDPAVGTTDNASSMPPYFALAFIMKT